VNRNRIIILVLAAIAGVYIFLVSPLEDRRAELGEQLEARYATLMKHERFILRTKNADIDLEDARKELQKMEQFIIQATDTSLAFAELQTKIQDIAASAGLSIKSIKPLPPVTYKGHKGLPIFMDATGGIRQLSRFLNHLDSTWEFISIDSMNVATTQKNGLRIKIQLSGLMRA
jgi:Tfp pilus assembly protein PilO